MEESDDYNMQTTLLPEKTFEEAGISAQWAGVNHIGVHTFKKPPCKDDVESALAPCEAKVYQLRQHSILFDPIIRKLVNEANGTFIAGQKVISGSGAKQEALKLSRQYRSVIRACIEDLQKVSKKSINDFYKEYLAIFYNIELIWHLTEIMFVNALPGDIVLPHLQEWIRFHFPSGEMTAIRILNKLECDADTKYTDYWNIVITLILQGNIEPARGLLRLNSMADSDAFISAEEMLKTLPVYNVFGGLSVADFNTRFASWKNTLKSRLNARVFSSCNNLELVMKMILGEAATEMKQHCSTWYELMVSSLMYSEPTVKSFDLIYHANKCIMQFGGTSHLTQLDHIILSLLECNLHDAIKKLQQTSDSGWAAAHLTNLLYICARLNVIDNKLISDMPERMDEWLVADYASLLMSHKSLWQAGLSYLDYCPTLGSAWLRLLLPRVPLTSQSRVNIIIQAAVDRNMLDIAASVCKVAGMKELRRRRLGQALYWALQSQDPGFATFIADNILEYYAREGVFSSVDLLDNLGSCMLVCDRLTFLGKYCEFHQVFSNGDLKKAAGLLISLLESKISPKYFWLTLLTDSLPLLESKEMPVFSYRDTVTLMVALEELEMERVDHPRAPPLSTLKEKHRLVRMALTQNLARATLYENAPIA
ncbi:nuclear pore complex protein Nup85 [Macrosteles quadrilineatus]|uniref:nuclear pore complex protein Nup85 n=1 Tax=Macrosteles quadrilineatus TaxID=74068 RepID=UPI0023E30E7B|nr:nuclear pore complex protein Nup85 [Macrosteles quadrilineatus]